MLPYHKLDVDDYDEPELFKIITSIDTEWIDYFDFKTALLPADLLRRDDFFRWLHSRHPYKAGVIKLPKNTCYSWHSDTSRCVCVNTLLSFNGHSHCLFAPNREEVSHGFMELQYEPYKRYVFNNQVDHMVINFEEDRYLLTLEFVANKFELSFDGLMEDVKRSHQPPTSNE